MSDLVTYEFTRKSAWSGKTHTMRIAMTPEQYAELLRPDRRHIQDLLPHCSPGEREFIVSGLTPEEWNALAGEGP